MNILKPSANCLSLITQFEGFSNKPYLCPAGIPTIGYGSTRYGDGKAVSLGDSPMSQNQAMDLLLITLKAYADAVNQLVSIELNQNQFDALVDFAYNAGVGNLKSSTLLKKLNAGDIAGAAAEFDKWTKARVGGELKELAGLKKRRSAERALFEATRMQQ